MASPQVMQEHVQDRAELIATLQEEGYLLSFGKMSAPANSYDPPGGYVEVAQVNVFPISWEADKSRDILVDDILYLVGDEVDARACTHVRQADGDIYAICKPIESFKFDGVTNIGYIVHTRAEFVGVVDT